ncbi:glycosyltransferase family 2 protein [Parabacteroides sp. Marseille-P3160]|uniref:glycosyltransferase family 2 protein n=1 Tax=Parabacteroides sp. Marseille-P3160 TaxID=1917887 RepID=UPI0009BAD2F3|nr:glycosyltransferase family 2 protein [Parabacteroides sp. Marseille-P3160]
MDYKIDTSIIIVNYNTSRYAIDAIDSIFEKTTGLSYEVIVVDNNSSESDLNAIKERYKNRINLIPLTENIGFGRANNEALKVAEGRNILFLNPDTKLINDAIKILSDFLDKHDKVGACGGNLFGEEGKPNMSYERYFPSIFAEINIFLSNIPRKILFGRNALFNHSKKVKPVAFISGADLMTKRSVIEEIGGFNPLFFMYYEETELCFRINKAKYKIMSVPEAEIQHLDSCSFENRMSRKKYELFYRSKHVFFDLCYSKQYKMICFFLQNIFLDIRIFLAFVLKSKGYSYWKFQKEITKSYNN